MTPNSWYKFWDEIMSQSWGGGGSLSVTSLSPHFCTLFSISKYSNFLNTDYHLKIWSDAGYAHTRIFYMHIPGVPIRMKQLLANCCI